MVIRIKKILKNQKGSSLAFVLIIGVAIMLMVASLLAVANSDYTFTQQTVESRQAYIDAKSVIEFGKIEINNRLDTLKVKTDYLNELYKQRAAITGTDAVAIAAINAKENEIKAKITEINNYLNQDFISAYYIGGSENNIAKTLKVESQANAVGVLTVESENITNESTKFTFKIETQKLRRKLDFEASFNYGFTTKSNTMPTLPSDQDNWTGAFIQDKNKTGLEMKFTSSEPAIAELGDTLTVAINDLSIIIGEKNGNKDIQWEPNKTLDLDVANVRFTVPIPSTEAEKSTFDISANTVIFEGDLVIDNTSCLKINCTNLWVTGNIIIKTDSTAPAAFINSITATNIIVGGTAPNNKIISISDPSKMLWSYTNLWLNGVANNSYPNTNSLGSSSGSGGIIKNSIQYY